MALKLLCVQRKTRPGFNFSRQQLIDTRGITTPTKRSPLTRGAQKFSSLVSVEPLIVCHQRLFPISLPFRHNPTSSIAAAEWRPRLSRRGAQQNHTACGCASSSPASPPSTCHHARQSKNLITTSVPGNFVCVLPPRSLLISAFCFFCLQTMVRRRVLPVWRPDRRVREDSARSRLCHRIPSLAEYTANCASLVQPRTGPTILH